jgi:cold-inducible RNA-binding protein
MNNKLYVGNLSFQLNEEGLKDAFAAHGQVLSAKIITDRETGRSKGFGFVEMDTEEAAENAISSLDGKEVGGRAIRVSIAREKEGGSAPRGPRSGGPGRGGPRGGGSRY